MPKPDTPDDGHLVGSGTFRLDRAAALSRLKTHQLEDPWHFIHPLLRAAHHQRAIRAELHIEDQGMEFSFEGRPWPPLLLTDPFAHLLASGEETSTEGGRLLAIAILACLRLNPTRIELTSGIGDSRLRWSRDSSGQEESSAAKGGAATVFRVSLQPQRTGDGYRRLLSAARGAVGMLGYPLNINGELFPPLSAAPASSSKIFNQDGRTIAFEIERDKVGGILNLYKDGVHIERVIVPELGRLTAHINDDALLLNLGMSAAIRNPRFEETVALAMKKAAEFLPTKDQFTSLDQALSNLMRGLLFITLLFVGFVGLALGLYNGASSLQGFIGFAILLGATMGIARIIRTFYTDWRRFWRLNAAPFARRHPLLTIGIVAALLITAYRLLR